MILLERASVVELSLSSLHPIHFFSPILTRILSAVMQLYTGQRAVVLFSLELRANVLLFVTLELWLSSKVVGTTAASI